MKTKIFLITLLLFIGLNSYCQIWAPNGATWYYDYNQAPSVGYVKIEYIKDTIITNDTCKVLRKTRYTYDYPGSYHTVSLGNEYIFQSGNKIYNFKYGQFYMLYDYSAAVGDIWTVGATSRYQYSTCDTIGKVHVDSIDIKIINIDTFKIIYTSPYQNSNWSFTGPIVEKLGCTGYMLPQQYLCDIDHNEGGNLRCYNDHNYFFHLDSLIPCDFIVGINDLLLNKSEKISLFPNPTNDILNISFDNVNNDMMCLIQIYDWMGKLIREIPINKNLNISNYIIQVNSYDAGVYLIRIKTNHSIINDFFIKN